MVSLLCSEHLAGKWGEVFAWVYSVLGTKALDHVLDGVVNGHLVILLALLGVGGLLQLLLL